MTYTRPTDLSTLSRTLSKVGFELRVILDSSSKFELDIFGPLFEVTKDPSSHPELHVFLQRVVGFDTVDDESKVERRIYKKFPYPRLWGTKENPPYSYWFDLHNFFLFDAGA